MANSVPIVLSHLSFAHLYAVTSVSRHMSLHGGRNVHQQTLHGFLVWVSRNDIDISQNKK
jgi:hypothetical protein